MTTLETMIRKLPKQQLNMIPSELLEKRSLGGISISTAPDISRLLLSSVVQHLTAFVVAGSRPALDPPTKKALGKVEKIPKHERAAELARIREWTEILTAPDKRVDGETIRAWCSLLSYAPLRSGGSVNYPDGGDTAPTKKDLQLIWSLARRSCSFMRDEPHEGLEFKKRVPGSPLYSFSYSTIDFRTPSAVYKVSPLSTEPQARDVAMAAFWAIISEVDTFNIYNPRWNTLYSGRISTLGSDITSSMSTALLSLPA